ncbi:hypothetical protein IGI42_002515 [Enterococcus sp. AZ109]
MDSEIKNWDVQVLDESNNVKYQSNTVGTEQQARALLAAFEKKWRDDCGRSSRNDSRRSAVRGVRKFY